MTKSEIRIELEMFIEMMQSDKELLKKNPYQLPPHKVIENYIADLKDIIKMIDMQR